MFTGRVRVERGGRARRSTCCGRRFHRTSDEVASSGSGVNLPIGVDLGALSVDDLHVGAALGGVDSHWKVAGSGLLTADGTPSRLKLDMTRSDGPAAHLAADLGFSLDRFSVDGQVAAEESTKGGVVAALIGRPDLDGMSLKLVAKGDRSEGAAELTAAAGDAVTSNGGRPLASRRRRDRDLAAAQRSSGRACPTARSPACCARPRPWPARRRSTMRAC